MGKTAKYFELQPRVLLLHMESWHNIDLADPVHALALARFLVLCIDKQIIAVRDSISAGRKLSPMNFGEEASGDGGSTHP